jgi:hypothetical protein
MAHSTGSYQPANRTPEHVVVCERYVVTSAASTFTAVTAAMFLEHSLRHTFETKAHTLAPQAATQHTLLQAQTCCGGARSLRRRRRKHSAQGARIIIIWLTSSHLISFVRGSGAVAARIRSTSTQRGSKYLIQSVWNEPSRAMWRGGGPRRCQCRYRLQRRAGVCRCVRARERMRAAWRCVLALDPSVAHRLCALLQETLQFAAGTRLSYHAFQRLHEYHAVQPIANTWAYRLDLGISLLYLGISLIML